MKKAINLVLEDEDIIEFMRILIDEDTYRRRIGFPENTI